ncbi:MAG: hypothetical protein ACPG4T_01750 [Nannocystaceae bacterium]
MPASTTPLASSQAGRIFSRQIPGAVAPFIAALLDLLGLGFANLLYIQVYQVFDSSTWRVRLYVSEDPAAHLQASACVFGTQAPRDEVAAKLVLDCVPASEKCPSFARGHRLAISYRSADTKPEQQDFLARVRKTLIERDAPPATHNHCSAQAFDQSHVAALAWVTEHSPKPAAPEDLRPPGPEVSVEALGEERPLLEPLLQGFASHFGQPIRLYRCARQGIPEAIVLHYPEVSGNRVFLNAPRKFRDDDRFVRYFGRLGFRCDPDYEVRQIPTPMSFRRLAAAAGNGDNGFRPALVLRHELIYVANTWFGHVLQGTFPMNTGYPWLYRSSKKLRPWIRRIQPLHELWDTHFHALGHDMSLHILLTHAIERGPLIRLCERVRLSQAQHLGRTRGLLNPLPLIMFFEEDLTAHCLDVWARVDRPEDFSKMFAASQERLDAMLERRLVSARRDAVAGAYLGKWHPRNLAASLFKKAPRPG